MKVGEQKTALILRDQAELDLFDRTLRQMGFPAADRYDNSADALKNALKKQYTFMVIRAEMHGISGLTFLQKIRETGNYGIEPTLLIADHIGPAQVNLLYASDIEYVLVQPITPQKIIEKVAYLIEKEGSLDANEKKYREAKAALASGVIDMAHEIAVQLIEREPSNERFYTLRGDVELKRGQISAARGSYQRALQLSTNPIMPKIGLMHTYLADQAYDDAARMTKELAEQNPLSLQVLIDAGLSHEKSGDRESAKRYANNALALDAQNRKGREILASALISEGLYDDSYDVLAATHGEKEIRFFFINKGVELCRAGKYNDAIAVYQTCMRVLTRNETLDVLYYNLSLALLRTGDDLQGKQYLEECLKIDPNNAKARALQEKLIAN